MSKDVMIRIKGVYTVENDQTTAELFTKGKMYKKNNHTYLTYEETETTGYEGCTTTLKIEDQGRVTMMRRGSTSSHLVLQPVSATLGATPFMEARWKLEYLPKTWNGSSPTTAQAFIWHILWI